MKKFGKGSISGESHESPGAAKAEMSQPKSGTLDALEKTDSFAGADGAKLRKGAYKNNRYN
jgi:hypothetical protein